MPTHETVLPPEGSVASWNASPSGRSPTSKSGLRPSGVVCVTRCPLSVSVRESVCALPVRGLVADQAAALVVAELVPAAAAVDQRGEAAAAS